ncbi:MAG: hypothetical protein KDA24_18145 [Deltaproteobacteria bacterium]|nr:hypothetical protein [Deltaproteobacteria bacterium]
MSLNLRSVTGLLVLLAALVSAGPASASWLQPHTIQEDVPIADVERALVAGKSRMVFDFGFSWKQSRSHFLNSGGVFNAGFTEGTNYEKEKNNASWNYATPSLGVTWGFSKNSDIYVSVPVVIASVVNDRMIAEDGSPDPIRSVGIGDLHGGVRFQFLRSRSEDGKFSNSLIGQLDVKFPTGAESPGSFIGGPNNVATIVTGSGTWGWDLSVRFKQQLAILAVEAGVGFTWNPTATVMYLIEDQQNQFNQHLDPGDRVHLDVGLTVQPMQHIAVRADLFLDYRTPTRWGSTVSAFPACKECAVIPESNGFWMDLRGTIIADFDTHFGLDAYFEYTLAGRRAFLWPLEDVSPTRGWTAGGTLSYRF